MSENAISLVRVSDLFRKKFFVPDYQRGYRWTETQVSDLLSDIYDFAMHPEKGDFYCLQPLVIKKFSVPDDNKNYNLEEGIWYEVIDGQQRLTTIKILFSYFVNKGNLELEDWQKDEIIIEYETRRKTGEYLRSLAGGDIGDVSDDENRDISCIRAAYKQIASWFSELKKHAYPAASAILKTLIEEDPTLEADRPVKFIVFEVDQNANAIDIFERINIGKISLTNAELIKALFLQKSNFSDKNENQLRRQMEIADAWDRIEYSLQDDKFWYFINTTENQKTSRIEFIFDFIYGIEKGDIPQHKDLDITFRFFADRLQEKNDTEGEFGKVETLWNEIQKYYDTFRDWFLDMKIYHYIGFLIFQGETDIKEIYNLYSGSKKSVFKEALKELIKLKLNVTYRLNTDNNVNSPDYYIELFYDKTAKKKLREFLLLLNIQYLVGTDQGEYVRFPFDTFKKEQWDIEHIDSYTESAITKEADQNKWIEIALKDLTDDERFRYQDVAKEFPDMSFNEKKERIIEISGESGGSANIEVKNSVGNLTLLDSETNRSYGNALYPTKRREIIKRDSVGKFILPCTKAVFLKYFNEDCITLKKWEKEDIRAYTNYIGKTLEVFMNREEK